MPARIALPRLLVAALLLLPACTQDADDPSSGRSEGADPAVDPACDPEVDEALRAWAAAGFSGTVALSTGGELACEAAYGSADHSEGRPNTTATVFAIGSVSKAFTAAAVADLVAAGELALDDRAGDRVPGLGGPAAGVTVEQLLLHTSGLTGSHGEDHEPLSKEEAVAALGRLEQVEPGEFLYSNAGYTLLAILVEEVTGTPYRDHLRDAALTVGGDVLGGFWDGEPAAAGPRAVGYDEDDRPSSDDGGFAGPHWATAGNGDLAMTTTELARWTYALFDGDVVTPEAVDLLEGTTLDQGDGRVEVPGWVRFDAERFGEPVYAVAGGGGDTGHVAVTAWLPESERVIALSSNTAEVTAEDLLAELALALVAGDPLPRPEGAATELDPDEVARVVGTYALDGGDRLEVAEDEGGLRVEATGPAAVAALFPPVDEDDADARAAHEGRVRALLAGETAAGREELALLEEDLGPVDEVEVVGTIVDGGELRTYVRLAVGDEEVLVWYAVDEAGGIQGVEITDDPPALALGPSGAGTYRPAGPIDAAGAEVTVAFGDDALTVTGPAGTLTARRQG